MMQVVQVPPLPPEAFITPPPWVTLPAGVVALIALGMVAGTVMMLWPVMRAIGRRLEGGGRVDPALGEELEGLRGRLAEMDALQHRMAELEERLDFAERLLSARRSPGVLEDRRP